MDGTDHTLNPEAILGCLLGTAVGDALGLPAEGLSPQQQQRLFGKLETHRLLFGRGMISDDTEHTFFTALAWLEARGHPRRFVELVCFCATWNWHGNGSSLLAAMVWHTTHSGWCGIGRQRCCHASGDSWGIDG
jgi:ADP-ribosylglycohydrolase